VNDVYHMSSTSSVKGLYESWMEASDARKKFYAKHEKAWNSEIDREYRILSNRADDLFLKYVSERSGIPPEQVSASVNEKIHSPETDSDG
jgi:hypothetical protein